MLNRQYILLKRFDEQQHFEAIFPTLAGVSLLLPMTKPSISLDPLHYFSPKPLTFMSLSTTFSHVIFGLPLPLFPSTVISILFFTQSFPSFLSTCPTHLSLLRLITSLIFSMPILSLSSAFVSQTLHTSISPFSFQLSQVLLLAQHSLSMFHFRKRLMNKSQISEQPNQWRN